jgi:hypothetical protein
LGNANTVCLGRFTKEINKKERDSKEIDYFYSLDMERNKERGKIIVSNRQRKISPY